MSLSSQSDAYVDALRLSEQEHRSLVREMDRSARGAAGIDKRKSRRMSYDSAQGLILQVKHPGGTTVRFMVKPRNLSRDGLSVLHGGFIHPGTVCATPLRNLRNEPKLVHGRIVTCRHIRGRIHELGIEFDRSIAIQDYVLDAETSETEMVGPVTLPSLSGRVLVVDEWADDRTLLAYDLRRLGVEVTEADGGAAVLRQVRRRGRSGMQLIVTGEWLGDVSAAALAKMLRKDGCRTPMIGVFGPGSANQTAEALDAGIAAVVTKPYSLENLARLLLRYLSLDDAPDDEIGARDAVNLSARWSEVGMRPMILSFLKSLEMRLSDLERQLARPEADSLRICTQLCGTAAGYGFPRVSAAAETLAGLIERRAPLEEMQSCLVRLTDTTAAALRAAESEIAQAA